MKKTFWQWIFSPKAHSCELRECEVHKYFRDAFTENIERVRKLELHSCVGMMDACKSLADRFTFQEEWVSRLHSRIDELESKIKESE